MTTLKSSSHDIDVSNAFKAVVHTSICHVNDHLHDTTIPQLGHNGPCYGTKTYVIENDLQHLPIQNSDQNVRKHLTYFTPARCCLRVLINEYFKKNDTCLLNWLLVILGVDKLCHTKILGCLDKLTHVSIKYCLSFALQCISTKKIFFVATNKHTYRAIGHKQARANPDSRPCLTCQLKFGKLVEKTNQVQTC